MFRISKIQFFESNSQHQFEGGSSTGCCSEYQRYNFLKAIHNATARACHLHRLFRISKIQFFESNSQHSQTIIVQIWGCSEYQRYNFLKAIHNPCVSSILNPSVVQNIKDTIFWKQFTTVYGVKNRLSLLFRISKIQFFESNSQPVSIKYFIALVVQNIKDTIFWKQFTTAKRYCNCVVKLFRISKIQFFESNSQPASSDMSMFFRCSEYQRYNFLKAIHNRNTDIMAEW